jgi:hypothetical protein
MRVQPMKHSEKAPIVADELERLTPEQVALLDAALAKVLHFGEKEGVTPDEMVALLESGMDVRELLEHIISKAAPRA